MIIVELNKTDDFSNLYVNVCRITFGEENVLLRMTNNKTRKEKYENIKSIQIKER